MFTKSLIHERKLQKNKLHQIAPSLIIAVYYVKNGASYSTEKRRIRPLVTPPLGIPDFLDEVQNAANDLVAFPRIVPVEDRIQHVAAIERPTFRD